jgi:hypothetical protein
MQMDENMSVLITGFPDTDCQREPSTSVAGDSLGDIDGQLSRGTYSQA